MKVALPSGRVVLFEEARAVSVPGKESDTDRLFGGVLARFAAGRLALRDADTKSTIDVRALPLVDFHALRALATHEGWLDEEEITVSCINCDAELRVRPCHAMPIGPFVERALDDEELDARLPVGVPHPIAPIAVGGATAETLTLRDVTLGEAEPLHRALVAPELTIDAAVASAMGIVSLGEERDPSRIAAALREASDDAFDDVARAFTALHYPLRLAGIVRCEACGARNDVDAPFDRELAAGDPAPPEAASRPFVRFRTFAAKARAFAEEIIAPEHEDAIAFVVEGGVAAVDEGGIALLGAYVPGSPGDGMTPSRPHEITVYYRTFRAMWEEDGAYDWEDELRETIEHEYEHFLSELAGGDPVDEEERRAITEEAIRLHGKTTLLSREVGHLGADFAGFLRRTWLLWAIVLAVVVFLTLGAR